MTKYSNKTKKQLLSDTLDLMLKGYSQGHIASELNLAPTTHSHRLKSWHNTNYMELKKLIDTGKSKQEIIDSVLKDNHHARLMREAKNKDLFIPPEPVEPEATLNDLMHHRIQKLEGRITQLEKASKKSIFNWWKK